MGMQYNEPKLGQTVSDCGGVHSATGSFYELADKEIYLDRSFFNKLKRRFGVEYNFAPAYVIAHEVGHHVQDMMGVTTEVHRKRQQVSEAEENKLELQADFLAGDWGRRASDLNLTESDIRSVLNAANAIGDDKLQEQSQGYAVPDAFTHGSSE